MKNINNLPIIAILGGTGKEGPGLAQRWAFAGYQIIIGSRYADKAQAIADELNTKLQINTIRGMENKAAAQMADICVLTVMHTAHQAALEGMKDVLKGKLLVDTTARLDFRDPQPPQSPSAAEYAQGLLGTGVKVVAAFQNVPAHILKQNLGESLNTDVLVCADDVEAAEIVIQLAKAAGMGAYYAGNLSNSIVVEGLTAILISMNKYYKVKNSSISVVGIPKITSPEDQVIS
jgi:8-hydroxy-5-deazaflavin:NADPH oxidoreductase